MEDSFRGTVRRLTPRTCAKLVTVAALLIATGCMFYPKNVGPAVTPADAPLLAAELRTGLPTLLDLGADSCIPCKMMAPVLAELKREYQGRMQVIFIDVWKDRRPGERHKIQVIPTQILFDASGKELFRHEGFFSREDILAKWNELGFDFATSRSPTAAPKSN